jgi:hypothetical protein
VITLLMWAVMSWRGADCFRPFSIDAALEMDEEMFLVEPYQPHCEELLRGPLLTDEVII